MPAPSGSRPTYFPGSAAPCVFPKLCPPAINATVSSSFIAIRPKVSRISLAAASGSGLPFGPSGFTYINPICTAPNGFSNSRLSVYLLSPSHSASDPQYTSSAGSHTSALPPPKPKVLNPIDSNAQFPASIIKSAHEIFFPYFCLIGQSNNLALSRFALSGQLLSGANRCVPKPAPPRPSAIRYVPALCHAIRIKNGP